MTNSRSLYVPLLDLQAQYSSLRNEIESAIREVCESQHFILGPHVTQLESTIAEYCNTEFGVGVSSGSDALLIALMALDIGPGDEVITTPFTFFSTAGAIARVGAVPVFCDINPDTFNLASDTVDLFIRNHCSLRQDKLINRKTGAHVKALLPVHLFGQVCDMTQMMNLAKENHLKVIEDAAQSLGAESMHGRRAGSIGDIGCFSFFPSKNLGAFGDAGLCTTRDENLAETLRILRSHGSKPKYHNKLIGGNFRLDALQAAIIQVKFKYLDDWIKKRSLHAAKYDAAFNDFGDNLSTPFRSPQLRHVFNQYTIRVEARSALREFLKSAGIFTEIYYPLPLHRQPCFDYLGYAEGDCSHAESASHTVLSLPLYPELNQGQIDHVISSINEFYTAVNSNDVQ